MKKFKEYFKQVYIGIKSTIKGLILTIKYFFKKKVTLCYPEEKEEIPLSYKGVHKYNKNKCIACRMCEKNCPVKAISIDAEGKGKEANVTSFKIDYGKCLYCALCEENCMMKAIYLSTDYDLSTQNKSDTVIDFAKKS